MYKCGNSAGDFAQCDDWNESSSQRGSDGHLGHELKGKPEAAGAGITYGGDSHERNDKMKEMQADIKSGKTKIGVCVNCDEDDIYAGREEKVGAPQDSNKK